MESEQVLLILILLVLVVDWAGKSAVLKRIGKNTPYWIKEKVNGLRNR